MNDALQTWRKKLNFLQQQEAIASDAAQKFTLAEQIEEAKTKIAELEAASHSRPRSASGGVLADISRILKYAPAYSPAPTTSLRIADCRLPIGEAKYPWESPAADLAAARKLIESCGYGRRKEELEDAEKALVGSPPPA